MDTFENAIPLINGTTSKNERNYPGWKIEATNLFLDFQKTAINPFTVEDIRAAHPYFDKLTAVISGWGSIPLNLQRQNFTIKVGHRTHDDEGAPLRHHLGLWWRPNEPFDREYVESIGFILLGGDELVATTLQMMRQMTSEQKEIFLNGWAEMESSANP